MKRHEDHQEEYQREYPREREGEVRNKPDTRTWTKKHEAAGMKQHRFFTCIFLAGQRERRSKINQEKSRERGAKQNKTGGQDEVEVDEEKRGPESRAESV